MEKTLVVLVGPPAVGKMTVGRALSRLTGLPLFHNHLSIEAVRPVFDFGTAPFNRLVGGLRTAMFEEVAGSDLPGLVFTYVWAFDHPGETRYVESLVEPFREVGARIVFAELQADLETRLRRNESPSRLEAKPSKRDVARSREILLRHEEEHRFSSDGDFPLPNHLLVDVTRMEPDEAARRIADHFDLPRRSPES